MMTDKIVVINRITVLTCVSIFLLAVISLLTIFSGHIGAVIAGNLVLLLGTIIISTFSISKIQQIYYRV